MIEPTTMLLSLLLAAQAQTTETPASEAAAEPVADTATTQTSAADLEDSNKVICKRTIVTGSKFKKKICGTKAEWAEMQARNIENAREMQRRGKGREPDAQ